MKDLTHLYHTLERQLLAADHEATVAAHMACLGQSNGARANLPTVLRHIAEASLTLADLLDTATPQTNESNDQ
jgi:hypothetical protein